MCELPPLVAGTAVPESCCGERRVLRRLAGPDASQGTSADNEVAVGQQQERKSFGHRDEPEPGPTASSGVASTWSSSSKRVLRASAGVRASAEHGVTAGSLEETVRPSSASVVR